jgi:pheromone shutdown protein TraB
MQIQDGNLIILGTSHVAEESLQEIKSTFKQYDFAAVGVELDEGRLQQLFSDVKESQSFWTLQRHFGFRAALFGMVARWLQQKVGRIAGIDPGSEMKKAVELARKKDIPVACIDRDIGMTFRRMNRHLGWGFGWNLSKDFLSGIFTPKRLKKKLGVENLDLAKVPSEEIIFRVLKAMKERYPGLYRVLVEERNEILADNALRLEAQFPDQPILVVVGAGHLEGMKTLLTEKRKIYLNMRGGTSMPDIVFAPLPDTIDLSYDETTIE